MTKGKGKRTSTGPVIALALGAVAIIGLMAFGAYQSTQQAEQQRETQQKLKRNEYGCTSSPVQLQMEGLERVPCKSAAHVNDTEKVTYETDPPTSGSHWNGVVQAGFYTAAQTPQRLVHNLEHGNVVIYYDKTKLSETELAEITKIAKTFTGTWDGVVAVPREEAKHAVILTAWEHTLRLEKFDKAKVDQFVDAFRGRGPENPVRPLK